MIIRVTFKDGRKGFMIERSKTIYITDDIQKAFDYETILEFKVSWHLGRLHDDDYPGLFTKSSYDKKKAIKFEAINKRTLETTEFDVNKQEIEIGDVLYFDTVSFNILKRCAITSSQWCYHTEEGKKDEWLAFSSDHDEKTKALINKIDYYERGLLYTIQSQNNWYDRYDEHSWHKSYDVHHKLMMHPIIQQICILSTYESGCKRYTIYEKKLN